jgi:hypothetical protein
MIATAPNDHVNKLVDCIYLVDLFRHFDHLEVQCVAWQSSQDCIIV